MRIKLFSVFILLLMGVSCASGFDDSVQRYPTGQISDFWAAYLYGGGSGSVNIVNLPVAFPTSNAIQIIHNGNDTDTAYGIESCEPMDITYISFNVRGRSRTNEWYDHQYLNYISDDGTVLKSIELTSLIDTYHSDDMFEFVKTSSGILIYINGEYQSNAGVFAYDTSYIGLRCGMDIEGQDAKWYIDDISTSSIVGMNEEWTQAVTYIDTSYGVQSMFSFPTAVYTLETKHVATGTVINTTVLPSNQGASDKPAGFVRWNRTEIFGSNWGLYHVQLFRDSTKLAETTFTYFDSTISGSVAYDQDSYTQGQTANIDYTISSADFATYTYYLKTMDVYGTVQDSYTLTASSGTKSPALADYDSGIYYAILSRTNKASGVNEEFAYDYASVTETVYITGNTTNALTGNPLHNVSIQYNQTGTTYNTTSLYNATVNGTYTLSGLSTGISTSVIANRTYVNDTFYNNESYTLTTFSFTPLAAEIFNIDLMLFPENMTAYWGTNNNTLYGLVVDNVYNQPVETATVNIRNATWSDSTTSTSTGLYTFHNLLFNGEYTINATRTGYTDTVDTNVTIIENATRYNIPMAQLYTVTVKARDATTLAYLSDFTATLDGVEATAVNGTVTFNNIEYGLHAISAIADNYYPSATTPLIDEDTEIILDLTRLASEYYAPHKVKFTLKSLWLTRYTGVTTSVYLGATALGDTYKTGTTGTDGSVTFELSEDVQYTLTFIDATQGIDETITLYPVDNEYTVYTGIGNLIDDLLNPDDEEQAITAINVSVTKTIIDDNTANITVNYNDIMDETSGLTLTLSQSIAGNTTNKTILGTASLGTTNNTAYNFTVTNYNGQSYFIEVTATHTTHGSILRLYGIQFENTDTLFGFTVEVVGWLAIIFLTWFALTATSITVPHTAIGVCALATVMMAIGWGSYISVPGLGLAWIMAIGANMAHAKEASA